MEEREEYQRDKVRCPCGNDNYRVYHPHGTNDIRLYCRKCGNNVEVE